MKHPRSKKTTTSKIATPAAVTMAQARSVPAGAEPPPTTIEAKIDIGFGNHLFVRGEGAGLSWDRGTPLECVDGQTWRWSVPAEQNLTFKLLLNDAVWAKGDNLMLAPGKRLEVSPAF